MVAIHCWSFCSMELAIPLYPQNIIQTESLSTLPPGSYPRNLLIYLICEELPIIDLTALRHPVLCLPPCPLQVKQGEPCCYRSIIKRGTFSKVCRLISESGFQIQDGILGLSWEKYPRVRSRGLSKFISLDNSNSRNIRNILNPNLTSTYIHKE